MRLEEIIDYSDRAISFLDSMSVEQLRANLQALGAIERCLQCISEAAIRIGEQRMAEIAPFVPFAELRGLGNRLRHAYETIDVGVIRDTVKYDLPALRDAAARALAI